MSAAYNWAGFYVGGNVGYFLIGLHAAAALFHHYVTHDNTLSRMLPAKMRIGRGAAPRGGPGLHGRLRKH